MLKNWLSCDIEPIKLIINRRHFFYYFNIYEIIENQQLLFQFFSVNNFIYIECRFFFHFYDKIPNILTSRTERKIRIWKINLHIMYPRNGCWKKNVINLCLSFRELNPCNITLTLSDKVHTHICVRNLIKWILNVWLCNMP